MKTIIYDLDHLMKSALEKWREYKNEEDNVNSEIYGNLSREISRKRKKIKEGALKENALYEIQNCIETIAESIAKQILTQTEVDELTNSHGARIREQRIDSILED